MMAANRRRPSRTLPRLALVGCGAAAREYCLPVLATYAGFQRNLVLVDTRLSQAGALAKDFGVQHCCADYRELPGEVDAAVITTPHHLHAEQATYFLRQGKPVFVEKPLGVTAAEVASMLDAAAGSGATLMVDNCRRLFPAYRRIQQLLHSGQYGPPRHVDITDGSTFAWDSVSGFYLRDARARGVLLDRGAHTIDILSWWLPTKLRLVDVHCDAVGGAEAVADVRLASGQATVRITFSRLHKLENCYAIECDEARIHGRLFEPSRFTLTRQGTAQSITLGKAGAYREYAWKLLENFLGVVQQREAPLFVAADVAHSIAIIDESYKRASRFELPWYDDDPNIAWLRAAGDASRMETGPGASRTESCKK